MKIKDYLIYFSIIISIAAFIFAVVPFNHTVPFSENQVNLLVNQPLTFSTTSNSFFPIITIFNQADHSITIKNIDCAICSHQHYSPLETGLSIPAHSSKSVSLNGEISSDFYNNITKTYDLSTGSRIFSMTYTVSGEPQKNLHVLVYKN